ncbi:tetratricopeptide repeat protein [Rhodoplanes azumiensis]|uniref:Tetratricopeptide repeat protein n=1 Tax=Rhodoplanes azumiensis TaxID=1897628 RepID=A0ABW5ADY4_9BRAD
MRTSRRIGILVAVGLALGLGSAVAFDASRGPVGPVTPVGPVGPVQVAPAVSIDLFPRGAAILAPGTLQAAPTLRNLTPVEAFRSGAQALRAGDTKNGLSSLEYAAASGHPIAQWKLGRMYAEGDGVKQDDVRAFEYFREVADAYADESPGTPRARFVANAFVALGNYYLDGIPNSVVKSDPDRAREMFTYAASYFGDPDAQYHLGRMYLEGYGGVKDARQAARWLQLAANKGQYQAQAMLGAMLFKGEAVPRQGAKGLMWLTLARDAATPQEAWITDLHAAAFKTATEAERAKALAHLEHWLRGGRKE